MIINNSSRKFVYFDKKTNYIYDGIYDKINLSVVKEINIKAHDRNTSQFYLRPDIYNEVIEGIIPIPPRSRWKFDGGKFFSLNNKYVSKNLKPEISELTYVSQKLCSVLFKKKIAIELSGGLDTSLVIGIIEDLGYHPSLIGITSSRFEYRTESYIQEKFNKTHKNSCLIDSPESLPFSKLKTTPLHQLPSPTSIFYMNVLLISNECSKNKIEIVLSGNGFDALLCENTDNLIDNLLPENWHTWMLDDNWLNEYIFNKHNIFYSSAAGSQLLINCIYSLRKNQKEDLKKSWARRFFSNYLPIELVNFTYKADFSGGFLDGFIYSKNEMSDIFEVAYDVTKCKEFSPSAFEDLYYDLQVPNEELDKRRISRVSLANWIYGLVRDKVI